MTNDLVVGELKGFRVFSPTAGGWLRSYAQSLSWQPGANQAVCLSASTTRALRNGPDGQPEWVEITEHGLIPDEQCRCGFWLYKSLPKLLSKFDRHGQFAGDRALSTGFGDFGVKVSKDWIVGEVAGWGHFVEGRDGYRVEWCKVTALLDFRSRDLEAYATRYDVPIVQPELPEQLNAQLLGREEVTGTLTVKSQIEQSPRTGRDRPRLVAVDGQEFKVWPNSLPGSAIEQAALGDIVTVQWEPDEYMGRTSKMIESVKVHDVLRCSCAACQTVGSGKSKRKGKS